MRDGRYRTHGSTVFPVGVQACCVPDNVGDVVLLVHSVEEVRHGSFGVDGDVLPGVALRVSVVGGWS